MSDTISRQWLMECVSEGLIKFDTERDENNFIHLIRDIAPPAEPEKGKWIPKPDEKFHCNKCDGIAPKGYRWDFCPNCGADMENGNG